MKNREAHEEAAGYGLDEAFWRVTGIDPDAEYSPPTSASGHLFTHVAHVTPRHAACDHDFKGWRDFPDGNGGEAVCTKCGVGAMACDFAEDW